VQFATLTARERIPATCAESPFVKAGGLMSYGTDLAETFRQVGDYSGRVLKGEKPAELPVLQSTKFEFVLNLQTARALDIEVPPGVLSIVDEVIECRLEPTNSRICRAAQGAQKRVAAQARDRIRSATAGANSINKSST
jgi:hypothetical protein